MKKRSLRNRLKDFLYFDSNQRISLLVLVSLIAIVYGAIYYLRFVRKPPSYDFSQFKKEIERFEAELTRAEKEAKENELSAATRVNDSSNRGSTAVRSELFYFNPNQQSEEKWKKLGLRDQTIRTIKNYESKGGRFKTKEDLKKIYGLHPDEYARLEPFIKIPTEVDSGKIIQGPTPFNKPRIHLLDTLIIDLNQTNVEELKLLPGIGDARANAIKSYRLLLGGYMNVQQLREVYGMDTLFDSLSKYFTVTGQPFRYVNINSNDIQDLKHPYMPKGAPAQIMSYRKQHGDFKTMEQFIKPRFVNDSIFQKLKPYLIIR